MNNSKRISIDPYHLSDIFWPQMYRSIDFRFDDIHKDLCQCFQQNDELRKQADYNTGSLRVLDAINILSLVYYFDLRCIAEVGTFIGNSTIAMAYAMELNRQQGKIHTCDMSNDIHLTNPFERIKITQYPKQSSTQMFQQLVAQKLQLDALYLDGRIQDADLPLIEQLITEDTIIAFDDFEGMEKGVANLIKLNNLNKIAGHFLVYPPSTSVFSHLPIVHTSQTRSLTALLIPPKQFVITRQ